MYHRITFFKSVAYVEKINLIRVCMRVYKKFSKKVIQRYKLEFVLVFQAKRCITL